MLHVQSFGDAPKNLVVLHGLFGSGDNWRSHARFWEEYYTVHCVDLPNHGLSKHEEDMHYELMATHVYQTLIEMGLSKCCLLGHSMGGKTAMALALKFPDFVEKLIIADIAPKKYQSDYHKNIIKLLMELNIDVESRLGIQKQLADHLDTPGIAPFLLKNLKRDEGRFFWAVPLETLVKNIEIISDWTESSQSFSNPALFITGEKSEYVLENDWKSIAKLFPNLQKTSLAHAGHWLHVEQKEAFLEACTKFLNWEKA